MEFFAGLATGTLLTALIIGRGPSSNGRCENVEKSKRIEEGQIARLVAAQAEIAAQKEAEAGAVLGR